MDKVLFWGFGVDYPISLNPILLIFVALIKGKPGIIQMIFKIINLSNFVTEKVGVFNYDIFRYIAVKLDKVNDIKIIEKGDFMIVKKIKKFLLGTFAMFLFASAACTKPLSFTNISPKEALELLKGDKKAILIDVRTEEEFRLIRIPGSILIPDYEIRDKIIDIVPDKNTPVILYCRSGNRSAKAAKVLADMGYTKVFDLGGIIDWPYDTEGDEI
jgi:rhodanese-related sulfurtransferase